MRQIVEMTPIVNQEREVLELTWREPEATYVDTEILGGNSVRIFTGYESVERKETILAEDGQNLKDLADFYDKFRI